MNFSEILSEIYTFSFRKMHLKTLSGKRQPFCIGPNMSTWMSSALVFTHWLIFQICPQQYCDVIMSGISNHQPHDCSLNRLFRRRSKITSKFRVTGLCEGNSTVTSEFPAHMANKAECVSIWWRHHEGSATEATDDWSRLVKLMVSLHYINSCWLSFNEVLWHSLKCNFTGYAQDISH